MRLEFVEGTSKKFWDGKLDGSNVVVTWGRIGTTGQTKTHTFTNPREAREELDALINEKRKKGYREIADPNAPKPGAREPKLEAAMFDARDDAGPALVYADWLTSNGNEWGELITVQAQLEKSRANKALVAREKALLKKLPMPDKDLGTVTWSRGHIDTLHVFNERDWMDDEYDVMVMLEPLLALPMIDGLRELRTGVIRWDSNDEDVPAVLEAASKRPFAKRLRSLVLGDIPDDIDMDHHVIGDVRKLSKWFPELTSLKLHSGGASWSGERNFDFGPLSLPRLESLVIETCSMSKKRLKQVLDSALPALTSLELWFGSDDYGANVTAKDLRPLLDGKVFTKTTRVGLKNHEFADELAAAVPGSALAARVEVLDFSMGTLGPDGVKALVAGASKFPRLKSLDVSGNYVTKAETKALQTAFKGVAVKNIDAKELDPEQPEWRYVSVAE